MTKKQIVGGTAVIALTGAIAFGTFALFNGGAVAAPAEPTVAAITVDPASLPYTNGLAVEQEAASAAYVADQARLAAEAEAARVAAEAEAARVAAEQEAARVAAEQAAQEAAEQAVYEAENAADWVPSSDPNVRGGGTWDTSGCASGRFETGANGSPVCVG